MTLGGWCLMIGSVGFVLALNVFCFARVLAGAKGLRS